MIIDITQTSSNVKQSYEIESEGLYYHAEAGRVSRMQSITLTNKTETVCGTYQISNFKNYIPFRYLFGTANVTRCFYVSRNDEAIGNVVFSQHGFLKSFYLISLYDDTCLRCYVVAKGSFQYVCVYDYNYRNGEEKQIALIETYLCVNDYKYTHKIYLLDDYKSLAFLLSFFTVYYSSYNFSERFHMSSGSVTEKRKTFSKYNDKYDPMWREMNFPYENFFGKISLF